MAEFLVFTLTGALGSFADNAGKKRRGTRMMPGRSAILGLLGAASGVRRDDQAGQAALNDWKIAVGMLSAGPVLRDFHTVQTVPTARIASPATRREAMKQLRHKDYPVVTERDYVENCAFIVAMWDGDVETAIEALARPAFMLSLGRRSCPLSMPVCARQVSADTPVGALYQGQCPPFLKSIAISAIEMDPFPGVTGITDYRWDHPVDRTTWSFAQRHVIHIEGEV